MPGKRPSQVPRINASTPLYVIVVGRSFQGMVFLHLVVVDIGSDATVIQPEACHFDPGAAVCISARPSRHTIEPLLAYRVVASLA